MSANQSPEYSTIQAESDLEAIAKLDKQIEWYEAVIEAAHDRRRQLEERLHWFAVQYRQVVGKSELALANGRLKVTKRRERIEVLDGAKFREWCVSHGFTKEVADEAAGKAALSYESEPGVPYDEAYFVNENGGGESVPVRKIIPGPHDYSVKVTVGESGKLDEGEDGE